MGLTDHLGRALARLGAQCLHVFIVEAPGAFDVRVQVERATTSRGWQTALSPADADALVVCGISLEPAFADAVEMVWGQMPGPRVRVDMVDPDGVAAQLDELARSYRRWTAVTDPLDPNPPGRHQDHDAETEHHDSSGADTAMDMDGMDMDGPGGIPLASGADDRDGLEMDVLHLPLGPVLVYWPAALTVVCTLAGDVINELDVRLVPDADGTDGPTYLAQRLDAAAQLLELAGAGYLALQVRKARNRSVDGEDPGLAALRRRLQRSLLLRWSLRRIGVIDEAVAAEHDWPAAWVGDVYDRLGRLLAPSTGNDPGLASVAKALPDLLRGTELGSARLIVASLLGHAAVPRANDATAASL